MKIKYKVVMIPTEKSNNVGDIVLSTEKVLQANHNRLAVINVLTTGSDQPCINQHLYILSIDEIKEGDWWFSDYFDPKILQSSKESAEFRKRHNNHKSPKVIASTDKSITPDSWIPDNFVAAYVRAYNEGKPITEVDLDDFKIWKREIKGYGRI